MNSHPHTDDLTGPIYHLLTNPPPTPDRVHLRALRQQARVTLTHAAQALQTHPTLLSQLERGRRHNHHLATRYQQWLTNQPSTNTPICKP